MLRKTVYVMMPTLMLIGTRALYPAANCTVMIPKTLLTGNPWTITRYYGNNRLHTDGKRDPRDLTL